MRLLFNFFFGSVSSDVVPLFNLNDRSMYFSRQTSYLETIWCTSKITKKYVDMQTTQSFHFPKPTHIVHN